MKPTCSTRTSPITAIRSALKGEDPHGFLGTFEFYPEEGKYHADGHRKCGISLLPQETIKNGGICPVCGKTIDARGVVPGGGIGRPPARSPNRRGPSVLQPDPLNEVLAEIFGVGPNTKRVREAYEGLLKKIGPEFSILHFLDEAIIDTAGIPLLAEAIRRMRQKKIKLNPGYDGNFGKIKIFDLQERELLLDQKPLFNLAAPGGRVRAESLSGFRKPGETATQKSGFSDRLLGKKKPSPAAVAPRDQKTLFQEPPPDGRRH